MPDLATHRSPYLLSGRSLFLCSRQRLFRMMVCTLMLAVTGCQVQFASLDPEVHSLLQALPEVQRPSEAVVTRLQNLGGIEHASPELEHTYAVTVRVPDGQEFWEPSIVIMEEGGSLKMDFVNEDAGSLHLAVVQSSGGPMLGRLLSLEHQTLTVRLDGPGMYWFGCPDPAHVMLGLIFVARPAPADTTLDPFPAQPLIVPVGSTF